MATSPSDLVSLAARLEIPPEELTALASLAARELQHLEGLVGRELASRESSVDEAVRRSGDLLPGPLRRLVIRRFFRRSLP